MPDFPLWMPEHDDVGAFWLAWLHPLDRARIVEHRDPDSGTLCLELLRWLHEELGSEVVRSVPMLPFVVALRLHAVGWTLDSHVKSALLALARTPTRRNWAAFVTFAQAATTSEAFDAAFQAFDGAATRVQRSRQMRAWSDTSRDRDALEYFARRYCPWWTTVRIQISSDLLPYGQTDGVTVTLRRRYSLLPTVEMNRAWGRWILLHELQHIAFAQRLAHLEPGQDKELIAFYARHLSATQADSGVSTSATRDEFRPRLSTITKAVKFPGLYAFLVNIVEDMAIELILDKSLLGLRVVAEAARKELDETSPSPVLSGFAERALQGLMQVALRPNQQLDRWSAGSTNLARVLAKLHDLRQTPVTNRLESLTAAANLYDILADELGECLEPQAARQYEDRMSVVDDSARRSPRSDDDWHAKREGEDIDAARRRIQQELEASIATGVIPGSYTILKELSTASRPDREGVRSFPEWNAWTGELLSPGTEMITRQTDLQASMLSSQASRFVGARMNLAAWVRVQAARRAGARTELDVFHRRRLVPTARRRMLVLIDGSLSMTDPREGLTTPLNTAANMVTALSELARLMSIDFHVFTGWDKGPFDMQRHLLAANVDQWNPQLVSESGPPGASVKYASGRQANPSAFATAFGMTHKHMLRTPGFLPSGPAGCRSGALFRSLLEDYDTSDCDTDLVFLTDGGSRYIGRERGRLFQFLPIGECNCLQTGRCDYEPRSSAVVHDLATNAAIYFPMEYEFQDVAHALKSHDQLRLSWVCLTGDLRDDLVRPHLKLDSFLWRGTTSELQSGLLRRLVSPLDSGSRPVG